MSGPIYRTAVRSHEDLHSAIVRAMAHSARWRYAGYEIICGECAHPIDEHETVHDCKIWRLMTRRACDGNEA